MNTETKPRSAAKMLTDSTSKLMRKSDPWARRHTNEMMFGVDGFGANIAAQVKAWAKYADLHYARYESLIGDDGYIGEHWEDQAKSILGLLNGETGGLDCGTIDSLIRAIAREHGLKGKEWDAA